MATPSIRNLFLCLLLLFVIVNFLVFVLKPQVLRRVVGEKSFDEGHLLLSFLYPNAAVDPIRLKNITTLTDLIQLENVNAPIGPIKLYADDFGEKVQFLAQFADRNVSYVMNRPKRPICGPETKTLLMIFSGPKNHHKRLRIRSSWMYDESNPNNYPTYFIIGQTNDTDLETRLYREQQAFGDMISYNIMDSYGNITYKTHALLSWHQAFCPQAKYVMKIDDDSVIYLKRFDHFLENEFEPIRRNLSSIIFCTVLWHQEVVRDTKGAYGKYFVPIEEYNGTHYPDFCQGALMLFSRDAVREILTRTKYFHFVRMDDPLYTGIIAENASIPRHHTPVLTGPWTWADKDDVPYLSSVRGLAAEQIPIAYKMLKDLNPKANTTLHHDYHYGSFPN